MRVSTLTAICAVLALSGCGSPSDGKESGMMMAARAVFAFKACTDKLEAKFGLGEIAGVKSHDMDPVAAGKPGEWDVKFTADVIEKKTGRVTRYTGVCHVRRDQPTTLDATFLQVVKSGGGEVRRTRP